MAGRGGLVPATPGKAYPNRTDMNRQPVQVGPSQQYGQGETLRRAQQAVPLPAPEGPPPGSPEVSLHAPTARPAEPITAGMPFGPGGGPELLPQPAQTTPVRDILVELYRRTPVPELAKLIEQYDQSGY